MTIHKLLFDADFSRETDLFERLKRKLGLSHAREPEAFEMLLDDMLDDVAGGHAPKAGDGVPRDPLGGAEA